MTQNPFAGARFLISCARLEQLPADALPEVAFAGRSNAGKSSALNRLCGQKQLARVSRTPGRTQLINLFEVPGGRFADLPGYGYAEVPEAMRRQWARLVEGYLQKRDTLRAVVQIMDIRHPLTPFDQQMLAWCKARALPAIVLLTKADKLGFGAIRAAQRRVETALAAGGLEHAPVIAFSATSGLGLEAALAALAPFFSKPEAG